MLLKFVRLTERINNEAEKYRLIQQQHQQMQLQQQMLQPAHNRNGGKSALSSHKAGASAVNGGGGLQKNASGIGSQSDFANSDMPTPTASSAQFIGKVYNKYEKAARGQDIPRAARSQLNHSDLKNQDGVAQGSFLPSVVAGNQKVRSKD